MRVVFIGVGVMGGAILSAYFHSEGLDPSGLTAVEVNPARAEALRQAFPGLTVEQDALSAAEGADLLVLAVKPKDVGTVLKTIKPAFPGCSVDGPILGGPVLLSVAAGLPTGFYEERLGRVRVVRAMPNTPAQIGLGITAISAGAYADEHSLTLAEQVLAGAGEVIRVPEKDQDAVSAISGSGPAYIFAVIDAMAEAGVMLGLSRDTAVRLAAQTTLGAGQMAMNGLAASPQVPPSTLREQVTSPGGTTARALFELDKAGLRAAFIAAAEAAWNKSSQLAAGGK